MSAAAVLETRTIIIDPRFNGPPGSGQGGYCAGRTALPLTGPAQVTLRKPVPLARELRLSVLEGGRTELHDGETLIAEAREAPLHLDVPPAPGWEESVQAAAHYPGFQHHPDATCFGCGPERAEGDGLRIFSAPRARATGWAAPWAPDASIAGSDGLIPPEMVWAALDCPSGWVAAPVMQAEFPAGSRIVTGQLAARIAAPLYARQRYTTLGWLTGMEGRKLFTGTALYDAEGTPVAVGTATWIVLQPKG